MLKYQIAVYCLVISIQVVWSQNLSPIQDILPPSPTASELGKYGEIPVNLHSGIPSISIPIGSIGEGVLSVPISLNYHAEGIKVDQLATWTGLGWSLSAGGVITRTVRGLEDDSPEGYFNNPILEDAISGKKNPVSFGDAQAAQNYYNYLEQVSTGNKDAQPDAFNFNIGGYSGRFIIENDNGALKPRLIPHQNLKIDLTFFGGTTLVGFRLIDPSGIQYVFGGVGQNGVEAVEKSKTTSVGGGCSRSYNLPVITSWYLREIIAPNNLHHIYLNYERHNLRYFASLSETAVKTGAGRGGGGCHSAASPPSHSVCETDLTVDGIHLKNIVTSNGKIVFITSQNRQDLTLGGVRLDRIEQYGASLQLLGSTNFTYDYYTSLNPNNLPSAQTKRLRLVNIIEKDAQGNSKPPYKFEYNSQNLPTRLSKARDFWGFANGKTGNTTLIPANLPTHPNFFLGGGDRSPDFNFAKAGILEKIIYPTGGSTKLEYEGHQLHHTVPLEELQTTNSGILAEYDYPNQGSNSQVITFALSHTQAIDLSYKITRYGTPPLGLVSYFKIEEKINGQWQPLPSSYPNITTGGKIDLQNHPTTTLDNYQNGFSLTLPIGEYRITATAGGENPQNNKHDLLDISIQYEQKTGNLIYNEDIGGLRIKRTIIHDGLDHSKDIIKCYNYTKRNAPNTSSGYGMRAGLHRTGSIFYWVNPNVTGIQVCDRQVHYYFSESQLAMHRVAGNHIGYEEVTILNGDAGENGKIWNRFSAIQSTQNIGPNDVIAPITLNDWRAGNLLEQTQYKQESGVYKIVRHTINEYSTSTGNGFYTFKGLVAKNSNYPFESSAYTSSTTSGQYNLNFPAFKRFNYLYYTTTSAWNYLKAQTIRDFDELGQNYVEQEIHYEYDQFFTHVKSTKTTNSDGTIYTTKTKYPSDYTAGATDPIGEAINTLNAQHRHNVVIEQTQYRQKPNDVEELIGGIFTTFRQLSTGLIIPTSIYRAELSTPQGGYVSTRIGGGLTFQYNASIYELYGSYLGHDDYGNPLGFQRPDDIASSFVWGYEKQMPIVSGVNAEPSELGYTSFEGGDEDGWTINLTFAL